MAELIPGVRNTARAVIVRDSHLLLLQKQGGLHALPGGGQETGESLLEALQRECREEIGGEVLAPELLGVSDYFKLKQSDPPTRRHQVDFLFRCRVAADYVPRNGPSPDKRQTGVSWLPVTSLADVRFSPAHLGEVLPDLLTSERATPFYLGEFHDRATA
ncbi:NUDIX domain-containing protein [Halomonas sp. 18H]|nr:NUDIX domain-containing protein [Halomonas sp. 18H]MCW4149786.1 NUDIX domain-containing protein [Halomonas sp. 18H]